MAVYELDDLDRDGNSLGYRQWRQTLRELAKCYETGDWSDPWERQVTKLQLPGWAFFEDDYTLAAS